MMQLQGAVQRPACLPLALVGPLSSRSAPLDPLRRRPLLDLKIRLQKNSESSQRAVIARASHGNGTNVTGTADGWDTLRDPAHIWAAKSTEVAVEDHEGDVGLDAYMQMPVTHYSVLDPEMIKFLGGNRFQFHVPRVNMLNVWVEPIATVSVEHKADPPCVVLKTESCRIQGSELIESLNLDKRFCLSCEATLTWQSPRPSTKGRSKLGRRRLENSPRIRGDVRLDVWCEVMPPFTFIPRRVLEGSCNVALKALMQVLLPMFMEKLGSDYGEWAMDAEYRKSRSAITPHASVF